MNEDVKKLSDVLLKSLYDYHFATNGGRYQLPKAMMHADVNSKQAIDHLLESGYATDSGEGSDSLVLGITERGMDYINNQSNA